MSAHGEPVEPCGLRGLGGSCGFLHPASAGPERTPVAENIGFIGLGVMGKPMAKHLVAAGHRVVVHNRSRPAVDELVAAGAAAEGSPADVARASTVVITMLPDTPDVERVLTSPNGVLSGVQAGA